MAKLRTSSNYPAREIISARLRELRPLLEAYGVVHAGIFGSVARGDDISASDVDILLEDRPERRIDLFALMEIRELLEGQIGGHVDLGIRASLRPGKHDQIVAELREVF
jgi:predicted nucleotidyltransferase